MLSTDRIIETDGVGVDLMPVVCSWCRRDLPAKVWPTAVSRGEASHGVCPACRDQQLEALRSPVAPRNEVTSQPAGPCPAAETGTAGPKGAVEHARACPVASSLSVNRPLFFTVSGLDFGRSIAWARRTPNQVGEQVRSALNRRIRNV
jgi:hypothetical protein